MFKLSVLIASAACATVSVAAHPNYEPVYIVDGQYTAALEQQAHRWRLLPLRGAEVDVSEHSPDCGSRTPLPRGLWYVSADAAGQPQLVAPSVTALPRDFPQHVALRACGAASADGVTLFVPPAALDWIAANVGTVMIDE